MQLDLNAKVIMCSSLGPNHLIVDAIKNGAKDFVVNPHFDNLIPILNKYA